MDWLPIGGTFKCCQTTISKQNVLSQKGFIVYINGKLIKFDSIS